MKKFFGVIGNPPYQGENDANGRKPPIYNDFMDAAFTIGERVELITPGRFLFNAGQTPTTWNEKMLNDKHLKVLMYESDANKVFPPPVILKGGVAVTLHDSTRDCGPIVVFTAFPELNSIIRKVNAAEGDNTRLSTLFASQRLYKLSDAFFNDNSSNPAVQKIMGSGTRTKITSSFIEKMNSVFTESEDADLDSIKMLARIANQRQWRYVRRDYLKHNEYLDAYKLFIPEANNSGKYGETLADPIVGCPGEGTADTFLNAGPFDTKEQAENLRRYYKTKFFRALLGARKVTQHSPSQVWEIVPLQDFTPDSDIDWRKPVADIDRQLYRKYGLTDDEVAFIESHVKEMS